MKLNTITLATALLITPTVIAAQDTAEVCAQVRPYGQAIVQAAAATDVPVTTDYAAEAMALALGNYGPITDLERFWGALIAGSNDLALHNGWTFFTAYNSFCVPAVNGLG